MMDFARSFWFGPVTAVIFFALLAAVMFLFVQYGRECKRDAQRMKWILQLQAGQPELFKSMIRRVSLLPQNEITLSLVKDMEDQLLQLHRIEQEKRAEKPASSKAAVS